LGGIAWNRPVEMNLNAQNVKARAGMMIHAQLRWFFQFFVARVIEPNSPSLYIIYI
jgi:hypothetical protein